MRIGIFGGSFDPVHLGHKKLADFMLNRASLDKIIIMPAALSPFKSSYGADDEGRLMMCREQFSLPCYEVSALEITRGGKSYTVDTLRSLSEKYAGDELLLIIGSDQLMMFDKWYRYRDILSFASLLAVSREKNCSLKQLESYADENIRPFGSCTIFEFEPVKISSSQLREMLKKGENTEKYISPQVLSVIESRGLYSGNR